MQAFSASWFQTTAFLAATLIVSASATAEGELVNLEWRPEVSEVQVGDIVEIGLYAVSDTEQANCFAAAQVILNWDPNVLELQGLVNNGPYDWIISFFPDDSGGDGLNDTFDDGDAWYMALANFSEFPSAPPPPDGLLMTTFQWKAIDLSSGTVITVPLTEGDYTTTAIFDCEMGIDIIGTLGSATVIVSEDPPCPGDLDGSGAVDLTDFELFANCMGGPNVPLEPPCEQADLDGDNDADFADFAIFQILFDTDCTP